VTNESKVPVNMNSGRDMMYAHRLNRDISELFSHDFCCSSSNLSVTYREDADDYCDSIESYGAYLILCVEIYEGPYRGGCYLFELRIPHGYPFKIVDVYSKQPIWHPNIELQTGRVALPIDWSPVLTLNSLAVAVQMIMLEPSSDSPLNLSLFRTTYPTPRALITTCKAYSVGSAQLMASISTPLCSCHKISNESHENNVAEIINTAMHVALAIHTALQANPWKQTTTAATVAPPLPQVLFSLANMTHGILSIPTTPLQLLQPSL
jgi:ubiquitin-protein ligase